MENINQDLLDLKILSYKKVAMDPYLSCFIILPLIISKVKIKIKDSELIKNILNSFSLL